MKVHSGTPLPLRQPLLVTRLQCSRTLIVSKDQRIDDRAIRRERRDVSDARIAKLGEPAHEKKPARERRAIVTDHHPRTQPSPGVTCSLSAASGGIQRARQRQTSRLGLSAAMVDVLRHRDDRKPPCRGCVQDVANILDVSERAGTRHQAAKQLFGMTRRRLSGALATVSSPSHQLRPHLVKRGTTSGSCVATIVTASR